MTSEKKDEPIRPLAHLAGAIPPAPAWFSHALATPSEEGEVMVDGAAIRYSAWGETGKRGLLFIHGGRAHRNWWRPFAPYLAGQFRVAALDLSGMGDSAWRDHYSLNGAIDEVFAVIDAAGLTNGGRPLLVGHSFGGWVTLAAVERSGEKLSGAIIIDSPIAKPDPDEGYTIQRSREPKASDAASLSKSVYRSIAEPVARFRFLPNQPCEELYLVDYIARQGLRKTALEDGGEGWTWKFDPAHGSNFEIHFERDLFVAARCPLAFIYGERSMFAQGEGFDLLRSQTRGRVPFIIIPAVHHHLMMEQPIGFIGCLRTLLSCWPIRVGH